MSNNTILIVLTSYSDLGSTGKKTGFHFEEMTTPYYIFKDAGYDVLLTSIAGGKPPHDPSSLKDNPDDNPESVRRFMQDLTAMSALETTRALHELQSASMDQFVAMYMPGGHGTMWDLPDYSVLGSMVRGFISRGKPVSSVCHGAAGLIGAMDSDGEPLVKGKCVNSFTNAEEKEVGLDQVVPFLLQSKLEEQGAEFESSDNFESHLCIDGPLITGQNPASAAGVANAVVEILKTAA